MIIPKTIILIDELERQGKLTDHFKCGLVTEHQLKCRTIFYDVLYELQINKVRKNEAVKRVAAIEGKDPKYIYKLLRKIK